MSQMLYRVFIPVLIVALLYWWFLMLMDPEPDPTAREVDEIMREVWLEKSSPEDRYKILTGLSALDCIESSLCELSNKAKVRYPSE